jgi:hypothetical protein
MDEVYKEFLKPEIPYVGAPDSIKVLPGKDRLALRFELKDPSTTNILIYWNNRNDSTRANVNMVKPIEIVEVEIKNLLENAYSFDLIAHDSKGNSSIIKSVVGKVYGSKYATSLLDTPVKGAYINDKNTDLVDVSWGTPDETALGMDIIYTNESGDEIELYASAWNSQSGQAVKVTQLENHKSGTNLMYRTLFLPDPLAIDTFYTEFSSVRVKGVAVEHNRSAWTAEGLNDGNRPPSNMLDGKYGSSGETVWHMIKTPASYPKNAIIDMKQVNTISGFYLMQRWNLDGAVNLIELKISMNGETWKTLGEFNMASIRDKQYIELPEDVECQYFEIIVKSDHKGGGSTAIAELGTFRR